MHVLYLSLILFFLSPACFAQIWQSAGNNNVGVGSTNPGKILDVFGDMRLTNSGKYLGDGSSLTGVLTSSTGVSSVAKSGSTAIHGDVTFTPGSNITLTQVGNDISIASTGEGSTTPAGGLNAVQYNSPIGTFAGTENVLSFNGTNVGIGTTNGKSLLDVEGQSYFNGNTGIGSLTPGQKLDVSGTARMTGFHLPTNASAGYVLTSTSVGLGTWMPAPSGGGSGTVTSVTLATPNSTLTLGGTNPVTVSGTINADLNLTHANTWTGQQIFNSANVGIGSTAPGKELDVTGSIRASSTITGSNLSGTNTGDQTGANPTASTGLSAVNGSAGTFMRSDGAPALSQSIAPTWTGNHIFAPSSGNTTFTSGNIGVGSASPGKLLDVAGTVRATTFIGALNGNADTVTTNANLTGSDVTSAGNAATLSSTWKGFTDGGTNVYTTTVADNVGVGTDLNGATGKLIVIGGNVGIGSISPGTVLDITGTARATAFVGSLTGTASGNLTSATGVTSVAKNGSTALHGDVTLSQGTNVTLTQVGQDISIAATAGAASAAGGTNAIQYNSGSSTFAGAENIFSFNGTNVGIGTTNGTNNLLDIRGDTTHIGNVGIGTNKTTTSALTVMNGNVGIGTWKPEGALVVMNGNVGIGTTTVPQKFFVQALSTGGFQNTFYVDTFSNNFGPTLTGRSNNGNSKSIFINGGIAINDGFRTIYGTNSDWGWGSNINGATGGIVALENNAGYNAILVDQPSATASNISFNNISSAFAVTQSAAQMTLTSGGNLGIGTTVPKASLVVVGNVGISTVSYDSFATTTPPLGGMIIEKNVGIGTTIPPNPLYVVGTPMFTTGLNIGIGTASATRLCIKANAIFICP